MLNADGWLEDLSSPWLVGFILALSPTLVLLLVKQGCRENRPLSYERRRSPLRRKDPRSGALPARHGAHRGVPPLGDELCVELCSDRWSTGLGPSALLVVRRFTVGANAEQRMHLEVKPRSMA